MKFIISLEIVFFQVIMSSFSTIRLFSSKINLFTFKALLFRLIKNLKIYIF